MRAILPLVPLLVAAGILLAGNGLLGTLIALRGAEEGFSVFQIGLMGTTYFMGFLAGSVLVPQLLQSVGHIRTFSALAAIATASTLAMILIIDVGAWTGLRFILGLCFSGLFATIESWLNSSIPNQVRGKVLSLYRLLDLAVVTGAQFLIPLFGTSGFILFGLMAILTSLSLVPVSLADRSNPKPPKGIKFDLPGIWRLSPLACIGCITIGMTNSAFRLIGPLYASEIGLSIANVAGFMTAGIIGGAVLQYPLGWWSDRFDRRWVLIFATSGATLSGLFISYVAGTDPQLNYVGIFIFGAFALPLYSLSSAHANDRADKSQYVLVATGLIFFFSVGATIGPLASSLLVQNFGPSALFNFTSVVHGSLILLAFLRIGQRRSVPVEGRKGFVMLLRTSAHMPKMARKKNGQVKT